MSYKKLARDLKVGDILLPHPYCEQIGALPVVVANYNAEMDTLYLRVSNEQEGEYVPGEWQFIVEE